MYKPQSHIMQTMLIALLATTLPVTMPAAPVTPAQLSEAASASTLTHFVKKHFGCSPTELRAKQELQT